MATPGGFLGCRTESDPLERHTEVCVPPTAKLLVALTTILDRTFIHPKFNDPRWSRSSIQMEVLWLLVPHLNALMPHRGQSATR